MDINMSKETVQKQTKKIPTLPMQELINLSNLNVRQISALGKDSKVYTLKQIRRDEELFNIELDLDEKFKQLNNQIKSMNTDLREMKQIFLILAKNFKNFVSKDELSNIKDKVASFKFEELATEDDLAKINN